MDDEASIRMTLPRILEGQGFEVDVAATVSEALSYIQAKRYDVLLSDLNIGEPGDGFTLVSAMRRVQPHAATLIITGFPAFETALQAIRAQVDDYVVKPAAIPDLIASLQRSVTGPRRHVPVAVKRASVILQERLPALLDAWLHMVKKHSMLSPKPLSDEQWLDHLPAVLPLMFAQLDDYAEQPDEQTTGMARAHGRQRAQHGFEVAHIQVEGRLLRQATYQILQQHLLSIDISFWITDMKNLNDALDHLLVASVQALLVEQYACERSLAGR